MKREKIICPNARLSQKMPSHLQMNVCACVQASERACMRACVRASERAFVRARDKPSLCSNPLQDRAAFCLALEPPHLMCWACGFRRDTFVSASQAINSVSATERSVRDSGLLIHFQSHKANEPIHFADVPTSQFSTNRPSSLRRLGGTSAANLLQDGAALTCQCPYDPLVTALL